MSVVKVVRVARGVMEMEEGHLKDVGLGLKGMNVVYHVVFEESRGLRVE